MAQSCNAGDAVSERGTRARILCLASLTLAASAAVFLATPPGARLCAGCGDRYGFAFSRVAVLGACALGAALLALLPKTDSAMRRIWSALPLAGAFIAHTGLILARLSDACAVCLFVWTLEAISVAATMSWIGWTSVRTHAGRATLVLATSGALGVLASISFLSMLAAAEAPSNLDSSEIVRRLAEDPRASDQLRICVVLRPGCSRCAWYMENLHAQVEELARSRDDIELDPMIYEYGLPGELPGGSFPAIHIVPAGATSPLVRLEPVRSIEQVARAVEKIQEARRSLAAAP